MKIISLNVNRFGGDRELSEKRESKVVFIGNLNVYQRGKCQFNSFIRLFRSEMGVRDLWLELDNSDYISTYKKAESRLDYALITPGLFNLDKCKMRLLPKTDKEFKNSWDLSDHRMLIVEIEEDEKTMKRDNDVGLPEKQISKALTRMFPDGGETYSREDVKRIFEEEGVDISDFDEVLSKCIKDGWITDCGNNIFTR